MKNKKRKILMILFTLFVSFGMINNVNAAISKKLVAGSQIGVGKSNWKWASGSEAHMAIKGVDKASNGNAFCTTFGHPNGKGFKDGTYKDTNCYGSNNWMTGKVHEKDLIIGGKIVDYIRSKVSGKNARYVRSVMALNTYFYSLKVYESTDFTSSNSKGKCKKAPSGTVTCGVVSSSLKSDIKKYISEGKSDAADVITALKGINKPKITVPTSTTLVRNKKKNGDVYYLSKPFKIEADPTKLATGDAVSTSVSVSKLAGTTVQICNSNGANCSSSVSGAGTYTVMVTLTSGDNVSGNINVTVTSSATLTYGKINVLCRNAKTKSNQAVSVYGKETKNFSTKNTLVLKVPTAEKELEILKVDENNEPISGASFKLYDASGTELSLTASGASFKYKSTDSLLGKEFNIVEVTAPKGYKISSSRKVEFPTKDGTSCYKLASDGETMEEVQGSDASNYCDSIKKCLVDGEVKDVKDGDTTCANYLPETPTTGDTTGESTTEGTDDGTTTTDTTEQPQEQHTSTPVCTVNNNQVDMKYCEDPDLYSSVTVNGNSVLFTFPNVLTDVTISKKDVTGKEEVPGAHLKICTEAEYKKSGNDCTKTQNIKGADLEWVSDVEPKEWSGIGAGKYYIIETLPPSGYKLISTATEFTIDSEGNVKIGNTTMPEDTIVINNALTEVTISKTDIVTTKELPGAKISICQADLKENIGKDENANANVNDILEESDDDSTDESTETTETSGTTTTTETTTSSDESNDDESTNPNDYGVVYASDGECLTADLADGSEATWVSGDKPHTVKGLPMGTYYLVEVTAPYGYDIAEKILFKMNAKGELTDIAGNSLKDNKIVMKDAPIKQVKTGNSALIVAVIGALVAAFASIYFFNSHKLSHVGGVNAEIMKRVKTRRIHKK